MTARVPGPPIRSQFYCLLGPVTRARPSLVVLVLNLRRAHIAWANAGPTGVDPPTAPGQRESRARFVQQWRQNTTERVASTRMLVADVAAARRSGAEVLVVVSPAPVFFLIEAGCWDDAAYRRIIAQYREAVEGAGGELVDLHDAVSLDGFRTGAVFTPFDSHFNTAGATQIATRLKPYVAAALGLR
jgi:hypothetical protein